MHTVVATHGHCFDGLASAVTFTKLSKALGPASTYSYLACGYGPGSRPDDTTLFTGEENALLDFRFSTSDKLTWFFDHHRTGLPTPADVATFAERKASGRFFFDPTYSSCTKLIADVSRDVFGVSMGELDELIRWADLIDAARFSSADEAVRREDPILKLASVVEHHGSSAYLDRIVPRLLEEPLATVANDHETKKLYAPIGTRHERFVELVRARGETLGRAVFVDLTSESVRTIGKFVTYALFPKSLYSVVVAVVGKTAKISVGYNPWAGPPLDVDISAICARHGGGGHPVVGAIPFAATDVERARAVARDIAAELS